jgi:outer membrane protein assembly factor BamA
MSLRPGVPLTRRGLAYDQNRIYSLRLFNRVHLSAVPTTPGKVSIVVDVHERWYLFPFPVFGIRDRDWNKAFFGLGILHANFLGRNEKLYGVGILGYDPSLSLLYRNPFLDEGGTAFLEARASINRVRNKSLIAQDGTDNYDERHISVGITLGQRHGIVHTFGISAGFEYLEVSQYLLGRTISLAGRDRYPVLSVSYVYDTRDLGEYPSDGTYLAGTMTKYGLFMHDLDYVRYSFDAKKFVPLGGTVVAAGRIFGDLAAAGAIPPYNHDYFGYGNRIRGHFRDVMEGEEMLGVTAELHLPLLSPRYVSVSRLPAEFSLWRFGVVAALFADAGTVWFRGEPLTLKRFARGYGGGLHFLLPYSFVLRTEYAFNEARRGEFVVDLGASL